ncbi:MAG: hypothetical protein V4844_05105 [Pseudomonadota bacterium]
MTPAPPEPGADADRPTGGGFGQTGPTAHVPTDRTDAPPGENQLDDALRETFPASDPISPGAAAAEQAAEAPPDTATAPAEPSSAPIPFPTHDSVAAQREAGGAAPDDIDGIFRELRQGRGRERVHDGNVKALIALAYERGDAQLELLLREWQSPCGEGAGTLPPTLPPP